MADYTLDRWDDFSEDGESEQEPSTLKYSILVHQTDKAWLLDFGKPPDKNGVVSKWLPKSECTIDTSKNVIEMPHWLMAEKRLEDYVED